MNELLRFADLGRRVGLNADQQDRVRAELDGNASRIYRQRVALDVRRDRGTFFTGHALATRLVAPQARAITAGATVLDPACGLGDLLLAAAARLPVSANVRETVEAWGTQLHGHDIRPDFIAATKARLYLLALVRGASPDPSAESPEDCFPHITQGDFFASAASFRAAQVVLINPPYGRVSAPEDATWAAGGVSAAAIFVQAALERLSDGATIGAILPDVLRSGTRYAAWRAAAERAAAIWAITPVGRFDATTDVDVFIMRARAGTGPRAVRWWPTPTGGTETIGDRCETMVGPVVPHRHAEEGPQRPYVHARLLPPGVRVHAGTTRRRFSGTAIAPPFVAVRRTCKPTTKGPRILATVVLGDEPVAVENHLIVLRPSSGDIRDCDNLMAMLASSAVTDWLNERIRCRHLTVAAVREIPWPPSQS